MRIAKHSGVLLAALLAAPAQAEAPRQDAATQQVLRKAQGALRQLSEEKAKLEADNAALQKEKTEMQERLAKLETEVKQLQPLQGELERQKAAFEALQKDKAGVEGQLAQSQGREQGLHGKLKNTAALARQIQADNRLLVQAVREREQWIGQCRAKNAALAEAQGQLIERYQEKGVWESLAEAEPLTGLARVKAENTAQDYQFKLDDLKATPFHSELKAPDQPRPALPQEDEDD